jgi:hypothetical protein
LDLQRGNDRRLEKIGASYIVVFVQCCLDCQILIGNSDGGDHLEELGVSGKVILKLIFRAGVREYRLHPSTSA